MYSATVCSKWIYPGADGCLRRDRYEDIQALARQIVDMVEHGGPDGSADLIRVKDGRFAATIPAEFVEGLSQALGLGISVKEERQ